MTFWDGQTDRLNTSVIPLKSGTHASLRWHNREREQRHGSTKGQGPVFEGRQRRRRVIRTVAGLRTRSLAFNAEAVDITHQESAGQWRELLAGAGVRSARVTGTGIFKDAASDEIVRGYVFNGTIRDWQVVIPTSAPWKVRSTSVRSS